ncbi:cellobiose dehydrogenase-like protein [Thermothelomyces thermophilus ATCC 42464]|uniref:Cellobiose dehydrogenase-like protein n=1 Tax=Thermothelomyces thermophilus (strain ATCC 42464 / BCRC 31852 / DSM 1799) TaxID=573729 RepID=G2QMC6_THET4|nr:cellobiose dehydrogenase-like protein [Thermothelomyces thermophilus ATCC 42464]AEO61106.1 cellobiose dehydrogenase-like protein [Thermothelomyces thermophilus ATCC 42464]
MLRTLFFGLFLALLRTGNQKLTICCLLFSVRAVFAANEVVQDPDTGLVFTSNYQLYKINQGITFRVAIPGDAQINTAFDAVIQLVVPSDVGWVGLSWGGSMPNNPLVVAWQNAGSVVLSPRWATGHVMPTESTNAGTYRLFQTGTKSNGTHWQFTALCQGCTSWTTSSGGSRYLTPTGGNRLAFAYSPGRPSSPGTSSSSIPIHDVHGYWNHDFAAARNPNFHELVQRLV